MTPEAHAERIFHEAAELPEGERAGYLRVACGSNEDLRERVERLLTADAQAPGSFLVTTEPPQAELFLAPGSQVGEFEILERIGQGGMGSVYSALQRSPRREVALKTIRPGCMTPEVAARFQREIEVLGNLRHPGIAQIHQAGSAMIETGSGGTRELPYFAMELVRGTTLLDYARARGLNLSARLELFCQVCGAVHHAHLSGVIHRDLKSENVLVSDEGTGTGSAEEGARIGQPKILDFGIARLADAGDDASRDTRLGEVVGTLGNISPEQLRGDLEAIDGRTDVYALGVLLYQLLADRLPIALAGMSVSQALYALENQNAPPLGRLRPELRGDLTVIAEKALEKHVGARFASAAELADDIRRHLAGEPILARAHSRFYLMRRTLRRHRGLATGAALVMVLLAAFAITFRWQAIENLELAASEAEARRRAEQALAVSLLERGRLLGRTGNMAGERLLWQQHLARPTSPGARWALREFYATHPCLASRRVHGGKVRALAFHPDGGLLASAADDGLLRLTHTATWSDGRAPIEVPARVYSLAFRPGTDRIVAGTLEGDLYEWDVVTGELVRRMEGHQGTVRCLGFDSKGSLLASGGDDGVRLWNGEGELVRRIEGAERVVYRLVFSPDDRRLVVAASRGLWVVDDPRHGVARRLEGHERSVNSAAFGPDGRRLYSSGADGRILAWDLERNDPPRMVLEGERQRVLYGDPSARSLVALSADRFELMDLDSGVVLRSFPLTDFARGLDFDGRRVAVGDPQGRVRLWHVAPPLPVPLDTDLPPTTSAVASYADDRVLIGLASGVLRLHDMGTRARIDELVTEGPVAWADLSRDGRWTWCTEGTLYTRPPGSARALALRDGLLLRRSPMLSVSPDQTRVAACGADRRFLVLSLDDGSELASFDTAGDETYSVCWSPVGERVATVARNEYRVVLHDAAHTAEPWILGVEGQRPLSLAFSPGGEMLAVGTWERVVQLWDVASRCLVGTLEGHEGSVWDVAFIDAQGARLVSLGADGSIRLWSVAARRELATFPVAVSNNATFLAASPGRALVATPSDAAPLVYDFAALDHYVEGNREFAHELVESSEP